LDQEGAVEQQQARELTKDEEIRRLQAENKRLRMEREILKEATAFFAKDQS
jgi:transposase